MNLLQIFDGDHLRRIGIWVCVYERSDLLCTLLTILAPRLPLNYHSLCNAILGYHCVTFDMISYATLILLLTPHKYLIGGIINSIQQQWGSCAWAEVLSWRRPALCSSTYELCPTIEHSASVHLVWSLPDKSWVKETLHIKVQMVPHLQIRVSHWLLFLTNANSRSTQILGCS